MKNPKTLTWLAFSLALVGSFGGLFTSTQMRGFNVGDFAQVPVLEGGRVKPLDSIARNALLMIRSQQTFRFEERSVGPDEWIADVMFRPAVADAQPIFVINDPDVLGMMGVQQSTNRYFSFQAIEPHLEAIEAQADTAMKVDPKARTRFQSALANLYERLWLYHKLKNTIQDAHGPGLLAEVTSPKAEGADERVMRVAQLSHFRILPGAQASDWRNVGEALGDTRMGKAAHPGLLPLGQVAAAYAKQDVEAFNTAVGSFLATTRPEELSQAKAELVFNRVQPFYAGMVVYVMALLVLFVSWLYRPTILQPIAFGLLLAAVSVHTAGLVSRVVLQGRPPVTNLYSSAVFVGWGAAVLGAILEKMYRRGFGTAVAAAAGFGSLIVAHHLAADGDTMEMMRAVLDSNFWLATHVVTITIGYSGTFLAGAIAIGYTLRKLIVRAPDRETTKILVSMAYGIVSFSLLWSFVGTVLGGIWADQSWGRFWGWDPKENGALLIVLWNAIILHARWAGYLREKGIMAAAIFGNVITALSWFGVNMLGVGLHSYGFMDNAFWALTGFCASQMVLIGLCLLPERAAKAGTPKPTTSKKAHAH